MRIPSLDRRETRPALACGALALGALLLALLDPGAALTGWLGAAVFVQALPTGALILLLMMRLIRGKWADDLRAPAVVASALWPLAALAFLPVLIGMGAIYPWLAHPPESAFARVWLSPVFFALRTIGWFTLFAFVAQRSLGSEISEGFASVALIALVLYASFVAVDWLMSLDPAFASSGFGLQILALEICTALAVMILVRLAQGAPRNPGVLGGLLLTLLLLWAYFQFLPFFISWSGNLPPPAGWYLARADAGWVIALACAAVLGGVPLFALLAPEVRKSPRWLGWLSASVVAGKGIEFAWFALPGKGTVAVAAYALALAGLGGIATLGLRWRTQGWRTGAPT